MDMRKTFLDDLEDLDRKKSVRQPALSKKKAKGDDLLGNDLLSQNLREKIKKRKTVRKGDMEFSCLNIYTTDKLIELLQKYEKVN
jgi:hypothetical protein